jgi:PTS system nitrogen regulatory IIA component
MGMEVSRALNLESCSVALASRKADEVLEELAELILKSPETSGISTTTIVEGLTLREELGSTGFGNGIAIPHCKIPGMKDFAMALGISRGGIPFKSMDKHSVHIFCCIVGPEEDTEGHLRLLAAAARVLAIGKARYELLRSETPYAAREEFLYHTAPAAVMNGVGAGGKQKLLMIVLQEEEWFSEIMELFLELGVIGAVSTESSMMGPVLSNVPIFASFMDVLGRSRPEPKTVMALVPESSINEIVSAIEEITGNLDTHRGACIIVLSPDLIRGSLETV